MTPLELKLYKALEALLSEFNSRTALVETCDMTEEELIAIDRAKRAIDAAERQALAKEQNK